MCGRFTLTRSAAEIADHFALEGLPEAGAPGTRGLAPRWNVAPGQDVPIVLATAPGGGARRLGWRRWGWPWRSRDATGATLVNARAETAATRPAFREALRRRRCLVPADGFYEWKGPRGRRDPWHLALPQGALFGMAALHEAPAAGAEREAGALVILTTEARGAVRALHDRMPVIVSPEAYAAWLDPAEEDGEEALAGVLGGDAASRLAVRPVSRRVNDVGHEGPACLAPPEEPELPLG